MSNLLLSAAISVTAVLSFSSGAVQAATLTWHLSGWNFDDGGTANGSFDYDADTNIFSNIGIITGGGILPTNLFVRDDPITSSTSTGLSFATLDGLLGFDSLLVNLAGPLTNSGGTIFTTNFSVFDIDTFGIASNVGVGQLTAASPVPSVPLPAGGLLLLSGLVGVIALKRRKERVVLLFSA